MGAFYSSGKKRIWISLCNVTLTQLMNFVYEHNTDLKSDCEPVVEYKQREVRVCRLLLYWRRGVHVPQDAELTVYRGVASVDSS